MKTLFRILIEVAIGFIITVAAIGLFIQFWILPNEIFESRLAKIEFVRRTLQHYSQNFEKRDPSSRNRLPETLSDLINEGYLNSEDLRIATNKIDVKYNADAGSSPNEWVIVASFEGRVVRFPLYGKYRIEKQRK